MKNLIIKRLFEISEIEDKFQSKYWNDVNFADQFNKTSHVSEVKFNELSNVDLVRFFEYIIRMEEDISSNRIEDLLKNVLTTKFKTFEDEFGNKRTLTEDEYNYLKGRDEYLKRKYNIEKF